MAVVITCRDAAGIAAAHAAENRQIVGLRAAADEDDFALARQPMQRRDLRGARLPAAAWPPARNDGYWTRYHTLRPRHVTSVSSTSGDTGVVAL